jgi:hypothetical protein
MRGRPTLLLAAALGWVALTPVSGHGAGAPREEASPAPQAAAAAQARPAVTYQPPARGAPVRRVGGASRSSGGGEPEVAVLAPEHVGLTLAEQPDLYWFVSRPAAVLIGIDVLHGTSPAPVLETRLPRVERAGIQRFSLRDHGVRLAEGTDYEWSVTVVSEAEGRPAEILSAGAIRRVAPEAALVTRLRGLSGIARASALAEAGIWYDALAALGQDLDAKPDPALREARAGLLEQVGLAQAAAFERR